MTFRLGSLSLLLAIGTAVAGDGISPLASANDYPAHIAAGKLAIGASYVSPAQVRKLFGDDLDRHGYVVFEVGIFPAGDLQTDISADDFKLRQGKDPSILRAATPHMVAADVHPQKSTVPKPPGKVDVETRETIGYQTGPYGHGVYTASEVGVGRRGNDPAPPPPVASGNDQESLQQQLEDKALPETKTTKAVAGYVFFPKPTEDKRADFELIYFGPDGQVSMKLSPAAKR